MFFIIGAPKCGTTTLHDILSRHPEICMSSVKEPSFFSNDEIYRYGYSWYRKLFRRCSDDQVWGESSTSYCMVGRGQLTPIRIYEFAPTAKILFMVRHPKIRTESDWMHYRNAGGVLNFADWLRRDLSHVEKNSYLNTMRVYTKTFGENNVFVSALENFTNNGFDREVEKILQFLNVDHTIALSKHQVLGQTAEQKVLPPFWKKIVSQKWYWAVHGYIPKNARHLARACTGRRKKTNRPEWPENLYREFREMFEHESRVFLAKAGLSENLWIW